MKTAIIFALGIASALGDNTANDAERYPYLKTAQQGRNFGNAVDNTDFNPKPTSQTKRSTVHNVEIPGYNPYDPARNDPGYFPNYSNPHLVNLLGGFGGFGQTNPISRSPGYQSYSSHTGDVTLERRSTASNSRYNNQPAYTKTTDEVIRYPGNQGPGITEAKTTFNYVPAARDISTRRESYPGGDVVITSNHPVGGNTGYGQGHNQNPTNHYPKPTNNYPSPTPRYNTRHNAAQTPVYPSASPTVYTKKTAQSATYDGQNGPRRVDSQTTFNYVPANRDITVERRPYNGGEVAIASNHPANHNTGNTGYSTPRYDTRSRGGSGYQSANWPSSTSRY